jgi:D-alanyl-D-alanine carboxypeptidase/D-alanyl-D-alanine-endopeptidase (penicillin-binding protein 4)
LSAHSGIAFEPQLFRARSVNGLMRRSTSLAALGALLLVLALGPAGATARRRSAPRASAAASSLTKALQAGMRAAGRSSSAYVVDLTTGATLFSDGATVARLPASVEKLYTTTTALLRFGPNATLTTDVYGTGSLGPDGTWTGNLYLKGGGDPTFGSAGYDKYAYGGGATMQQLVANLVKATGITAVDGSIIGDESYFDSDRGTPATNNRPNAYVEGELSALAYDRGLANTAGTAFQTHPALFAADAFASALKAVHVKVPSTDRIFAGRTPGTAKLLTAVHSPRVSTLIKWTNAPSDNFFAEMLLKGLGAKFGGAGTTAAGVAVVKSEIARQFGIDPQFDDGSGLSYDDHTTPIQIETLLAKMAGNANFTGSLAVAGETGTLQDEMTGTSAQGNCRGKTGTLQVVSNLAGYCTAANGDDIAFAFLMNNINPNTAHPIQDHMAEALVAYDG